MRFPQSLSAPASVVTCDRGIRSPPLSNAAGSADLLERAEVVAPFPQPLAARLTTTIAGLAAAMAADDPDVSARARVGAAAATLLADLLSVVRLSAAPVLPPAVERVVAAMDADLARAWPRGALARLAGLSESRFHTVFTAAVGDSPINWLRRRRLRYAQRLLLDTDLPIAAIAGRVGFADPFHFSRCFSRCCGCAPAAWRLSARVGG